MVARHQIRAFAEQSLDVLLPDIPLTQEEGEEESEGHENTLYNDPTLARSLHPSECSSFRRVFECARSVLSARTSCSFFSYGPHLKYLATTRSLDCSSSTMNELSSSLRSISIREKKGYTKLLDGDQYMDDSQEYSHLLGEANMSEKI
jgi:hypothetical protein